MSFFKDVKTGNLLMLILCVLIIIVAEYLFLSGEQLHGFSGALGSNASGSNDLSKTNRS